MQFVFQTGAFYSLLIAMILGMILGLERFIAHKTASMRTYTLIAMGACLFIVISQSVTTVAGMPYIAAQIIAAAGFLGVGAIFRTNEHISGITTASGLWVAAGIGMACGFGFYQLAILVTVLVLFIFIVLWFIESKLSKLAIRQKHKLDEDILS